MERIKSLADDVMSSVFGVIAWGVVPSADNAEELAETLCDMVGEQVWGLVKDGECSIPEAVRVSAMVGEYISAII